MILLLVPFSIKHSPTLRFFHASRFYPRATSLVMFIVYPIYNTYALSKFVPRDINSGLLKFYSDTY